MMKFRINRVGERIVLECDGVVTIGNTHVVLSKPVEASMSAEVAAQGLVQLRLAARSAATHVYAALLKEFREHLLRGVEEAVVRLAPEALARGTRDPSEALTAYLAWDGSGVSIVVPEDPATPQSLQSEG